MKTVDFKDLGDLLTQEDSGWKYGVSQTHDRHLTV